MTLTGQRVDERGGGSQAGSMLDYTNVDSSNNVGAVRLLRRADGIEPRGVLQTIHGDARNTGVAACTLGFRIVEQGGGAAAPAARWDGLALLRWGVGGARQEAEIDWRQGCHVAVPASFFEVAARYQTDDVGQVDVVECRASLAWGSEPSRSYPTRSFGPLVIDAGAMSPILPVPAFAIAFLLAAPALPGPYTALFEARFFGDPAGTTIIEAADGVDLRAALAGGEGVHLHGSARFWRLVNGDDAPQTVWPWFVIAL